MPGKAFVGRVGGLAVALGVGAAIVTGWSSGLAWADESSGAAGSTASNTTSGTKVTKIDPSPVKETTKDDDPALRAYALLQPPVCDVHQRQ